MPSPRKRRQRKVLLREQEREEVLEMLPIEEEAPKAKKKTIAKKVAEVLSLDEDEEEE